MSQWYYYSGNLLFFWHLSGYLHVSKNYSDAKLSRMNATQQICCSIFQPNYHLVLYFGQIFKRRIRLRLYVYLKNSHNALFLLKYLIPTDTSKLTRHVSNLISQVPLCVYICFCLSVCNRLLKPQWCNFYRWLNWSAVKLATEFHF